MKTKSQMKPKTQMGFGEDVIPGPTRATDKPAGAITIMILRKPTDHELEVPSVAWTWKALSIIYYDGKLRQWDGLRDLQRMARRLNAFCTLHSLRVGIRELVDFGVITCTPNPGIGERLPD